jgi:hypothetical protein
MEWVLEPVTLEETATVGQLEQVGFELDVGRLKKPTRPVSEAGDQAWGE